MDGLHGALLEVRGAAAGADVTYLRLFELQGGPIDGKVVRASSAYPLIMFDEPRDKTLLDEIDAIGVWEPKRSWYVAEERAGALAR